MPPPRKGRAAAVIVSLAVMGSRFFGLLREQVFAAMFGASSNMDAFLAAFQIPNLLRDLFAEGALSTAFTTIFAKTAEKDGDAPAWRLGSLVLSTLILILGLLCLAGIAFSPLLVNATSLGFHAVPGKFELTVYLTRILFPFILFISLAAAVMGMLNARFVFGIPALAPLSFNLASILGGVGLAYLLEPQPNWLHPQFTSRALVGVALGVLLGGLAQLTFQLPALWRQGFRFRWRLDFRDPGLRAIGYLMGPALIAASVVEVNILVNAQFASTIDGARSWLSYAFRVIYFPIGMFGVAIATVTLPSIARFEANKDRVSFGKQVEEAIRLSLFMTLPTAIGIFALAPDIVNVLYERGAFSPASTAHTAAALRAYAVGLAGYAGAKVLVPCFYALGLPKIPLRISLLAVLINLALNTVLILVFKLGHVGVAASTAGVAIVNFSQLAWRLRREVPLGALHGWIKLIGLLMAGGLLCGIAAWGACAALEPALPHHLLGRVLRLLTGVTVGALLYAAFTWVCNIPETRTAARIVLNKWSRNRRTR